MSLKISDTGQWSIKAQQVVGYAVRPIRNVLGETFNIPCPQGGEFDILGRSQHGSERRVVVVDAVVMAIYGTGIRAFLERHGIDYRIVITPGGEAAKNMRTVFRICRELDNFGVSRRSEPVIVFGGGVLNDVVGMAASIYRRGIDRIVYGTTLVALVDATVGAKTGCDHNGFKNRLGTYRPARLVIADKSFLASQDLRRISDGLAEIMKLAIVCDGELFKLLEENGRIVLNKKFNCGTEAGEQAANSIIQAAIGGMLSELHNNLWEDNLARATYFGHTWSPKVEMVALQRSKELLPWRRRAWLLHGEAVALDMLMSVYIAHGRDLLTQGEVDRIIAVLDQLELPMWDSIFDEPDVLAAGFEDSIRHRDGQQLLPLPKSIGNVAFVNDVTPKEVEAAVGRMRALGGRSLG